MNKYEKALSTAFGIEVQPVAEGLISSEISNVSPDETSLNEDAKFDIAHETLTTLITRGTNALEDLTEIARTEESPRAYEVVNTMIATLADTSIRLLEIEERKLKIKKLKRDLDKTNEAPSNRTINGDINNTVVIGTTTEILNMIRPNQPITIIDEKK